MTGFERLSSGFVHALTDSFLPPIFQACIIAEQSLQTQLYPCSLKARDRLGARLKISAVQVSHTLSNVFINSTALFSNPPPTIPFPP